MGADPCACACACVCCIIALPVAFYAAQQFTDKHSQYEQPVFDAIGYLRTPENMTATMFFPDCTTQQFKDDMTAFNKDQPWKLVHFSSEQGDQGQQVVNLSAWWLPVKDPNAPRIVVQHGNNVNNNDFVVQVTAYYLRSMGFAALLPNLRDHGSSGKSDHGKIGWAWDYFLDVQAAWEYAVNDPDGELGGKMDKSKVGILGQSMGGFASATAFGHKHDVPGLWLDSAVFSPKDVLEFQISKVTGSFLAWFIVEPAWVFAGWMAGVDVNGVMPEEALADAPPRPVYYVHGKTDSVIPWTEATKYAEFFKSKGYAVNGTIADDATCGNLDHVTVQMATPEFYYNTLCHFWTRVFGTNSVSCENSPLKPHANDTRLYGAQPMPARVTAALGRPSLGVGPFALGLAALAATVAVARRCSRARGPPEDELHLISESEPNHELE